jgi:hypothetical protein
MAKGILIDFQEAKDALFTARPNPVEESSLTDAVEAFAFAQLPKRNRIALVLAGIYGGDAESQLDSADQIGYYMQNDFTVPYKEPVAAVDATLADILS